MKITITALAHKVLPMQTFKNDFKKQELILDLDPGSQYENQISVTFTKDKCALLDSVVCGERVTVDAYVQGRGYLKDGRPEDDRRWFNELRGFSVSQEVVKEEKDEPIGDLPF